MYRTHNLGELNIKNVGEEVELSGWVQKIRNLGGMIFIDLRDRSGIVQIVVRDGSEFYDLAASLKSESVLKVTGKVMDSPKVKLNGMEVIPSKIEVTSVNQGELPFNYKDISTVNLDTRLDYRFIDLRNEQNACIFKAQSCLVKYLREYC